MDKIDEQLDAPVQFHHPVPLVFGNPYGDTGESGEAYDAEAKAEAWAKAESTAAI